MSQESEGWSIKKEVSLGDLIAIIVAITAVMSAYMTLNTRLAVIETVSNTSSTAIAGTINDIKTELRRMNDKMERIMENGAGAHTAK